MKLYKWILINFKIQLMNYKFWILLLFGLVFISVFQVKEANEILILNLSTDFHIEENLSKIYNTYEIIEVDNMDELKSRFDKGEAACAFVIKEDIADKIKTGKFKDSIDFFYSYEVDVADNIKEKIFSMILNDYSYSLLDNLGEKYIYDYSEDKRQYIVKQNQVYMTKLDLLNIEENYIGFKEITRNYDTSKNMFAMIVFFLIVVAVEIMDDSHKDFFNAFEKKDKLRYQISSILVDLSMYAIVFFIFLY